jgi:hypothetical protein
MATRSATAKQSFARRTNLSNDSSSDSDSDFVSDSQVDSPDSGDDESVIPEDLDLYDPRYACQLPINLKG